MLLEAMVTKVSLKKQHNVVQLFSIIQEELQKLIFLIELL